MGSNALDLLFRIRADSDQARKEIKTLRNTFEAELKSMEKGGSTALLRLGDSMGFTSSQMAGMAKAAPLVATALAGITAGAVGAVAGLFALAVKTSEFGSAIFDASEKTGLGAETLSALKFAADESGSSMAELEVGMKVFAKTVADAARGSVEAADKLKRLGIDPLDAINDLEGALSQAFKVVNQAPEGIKQMNAAMDAFGSRSGPNAIATIKSFHGDLGALIARAKELGVTLTDEDAKAADEFGDTLHALSAQSAGMAMMFAREFMPVITQAMNDLSKFVKENKEQFKAWGQVVADAIRGVRAFAESELVKVIALLAKLAILLPAAQAKAAFGAGEQPTYGEDTTGPGARNKAGSDAAAAQGTFDLEQSAAADAAAAEAAAKRIKAASDARLSLLQTAEREAARIRAQAIADARKDYDKGNIDREQFTEKAIAIERAFLNAIVESIQAERAEMRGRESETSTLLAKEAALKERLLSAQSEFMNRRQEIVDSASQDAITRLQTFQRRDEEIQSAQDTRELARLEDAEAHKLLTHEDAEQKRNAVIASGLIRRKAALETELAAVQGNALAVAEIQHKLTMLSMEFADAVVAHNVRMQEAEKLTREEKEKTLEQERERHRIQMEIWEEEAEQHRRDAAAQAATTFGGGFGGTVLDGLGDMVGLVRDAEGNVSALGTAFSNMGNIALQAIGGLAQGVGALVQNLVLMGNAGGGSMKKLVASVLAGVAAQAATMAVLHLAIGIAALTPWGMAMYGPAPMWFQSAAMLGALALGTGLVGRAVAGNSFAPGGVANTGGANAGGGAGAGGSGRASNELNIIERERNQQSINVHTYLHIETNEHAVINAFEKDVRNNGRMRNMIVLKGEV